MGGAARAVPSPDAASPCAQPSSGRASERERERPDALVAPKRAGSAPGWRARAARISSGGGSATEGTKSAEPPRRRWRAVAALSAGMTEFLAASNSVAQRPPPIATRTSRKVFPELSRKTSRCTRARARRSRRSASAATRRASTQRLGSDASIASTPTLFETSPSSSFRNADGRGVGVPIGGRPRRGNADAADAADAAAAVAIGARVGPALLARALRVSPPAGRRSPSSAEH